MKKDWPKKRLGDIASVSTGPFGSLLHKADYISDGIPLVNPVNIRDGSIIPNPEKSINEATKRRLSDYTLEEKDVVVGRRGEIGRCAVVGPDEAGWICGTGSFFVRPSLSINPHFLAHSLRSDRYRAQLEKSSTGTTMSNLSNKALENLIIAVPPLLEQERIVIAIDRVSAKIGAAISNAEKNLSNARELLETYLCTIFTQRGAGWIEKRLSSICRQITVGHVGSMAGHYKASGVPFLRSQNIRPFEVSLENVVYIDEAFHAELAKSRLLPGDLAIVRTGYPGTAAVVPLWLPDANCSDLVIMRTGSEVDPHYLAAFFNSTHGKALVLGKIVGAAQKHFNVGDARDVTLHLPSVEAQQVIVKTLQTFLEATDRLESIYRRKMVVLLELKQAMLQQALLGGLLGQRNHVVQEAAE